MKKETEGYLSVFLSMTLTVMLSLCLVLIEGARQNVIRLETECMVDVGMNSVLAEYHREVFRQYNLFYIDSSYGTERSSYYFTEARLREYIEKNNKVREKTDFIGLDLYQAGVYLDLLKLEFPKVKVTGVALATDSDGYVFQKQAIQAVKSDIGINAIEEVLDWVQIVEENKLLTNQVDEKIHVVEQEIRDLRRKEQLDEKVWIEVAEENPVSEILEERKKGLLYWVMENVDEVSEKAVDTRNYLSARKRQGRINQGSLSEKIELSVSERLLFQEYLCRYAGSFTHVKENAGLDYQMEYLLFGEESDTMNLRKTAAAVCGLRETANLIYLMSSAEKRESVTALSSLLSAALFLPEAEPIFETLIFLGWSCLESIQDVKCLLSGGKVPLLKNDTSWQSDLGGIVDWNGADEKSQKDRGQSYEDYLKILLYFNNLETLTDRFMDIMEMDIRLTKGNEAFRMDGCIDYIEAEVVSQSAYGYTYRIKHSKGYR